MAWAYTKFHSTYTIFKVMKQIAILVATHKAYEFPESDIYLPIQVGSEVAHQDLELVSDAEGEHISSKNASYCELTALYWAWKNGVFEHNDYVGLVHYRRFFRGKKLQVKKKTILDKEEIQAYLENADCIVPHKRCYYIESIYSHYKNAHYIEDLDKAIAILLEKYPEYQTACQQVLKGSSLHLFNMFIMKSQFAKQYCEWLFPILFELEKQLDISDYSAYQKRVFGFIAERLFNIWLKHNNLKTHILQVVNLEPEILISKVFNLLKRKFLKYGKK